jgi:hypothetical protein
MQGFLNNIRPKSLSKRLALVSNTQDIIGPYRDLAVANIQN